MRAVPDPTPADLLDISEEIEGIPDSKESGGVILVDSGPDKNLNEPVEGNRTFPQQGEFWRLILAQINKETLLRKQ